MVGFDDHLMASAHVPPLTSVRYPLAEAGRRAVELLAGVAGRGPLPAGDDGDPAGARRPPFLRLPALRTGGPGIAAADATIPLADAVAAEMAAAALRSGAVATAAAAAASCSALLAGLQGSLRAGSPRRVRQRP